MRDGARAVKPSPCEVSRVDGVNVAFSMHVRTRDLDTETVLQYANLRTEICIRSPIENDVVPRAASITAWPPPREIGSLEGRFRTCRWLRDCNGG